MLASNADDALRLVGERGRTWCSWTSACRASTACRRSRRCARSYPDVYVVIMTAHGTSQTSIDAIRAGAFEYVTKPLDLDELRAVIATRCRPGAGARRCRRRPRPTLPPVALVGDSPSMQDVYKMIGRLATNDVPGAGRRRARHRQGAGGGDDSRQQRPPRSAVRHDRLHRRRRPRRSRPRSRRRQGGTLHLASVHALPRAAQARRRPRAARRTRTRPGRARHRRLARHRLDRPRSRRCVDDGTVQPRALRGPQRHHASA